MSDPSSAEKGIRSKGDRRGGRKKGAGGMAAPPTQALAKAIWKGQAISNRRPGQNLEDRKAAAQEARKLWRDQKLGFLALARGIVRGLAQEGYEIRKKK
jgi:hypothetical protein